jgi:hypothetical protein
MDKAANVFNKIIAFCLLIAALVVLAVSSVTTIYYDMHIDVDFPQYGKENIPLLAVLVGLVFATLFFIYKSRKLADFKKISKITLLVIAGYCFMLIFAIRPLPVDDSKLLDDVINEFSRGNYSSLTDKTGYLYIWPFQLGYTGFGQLMVRFFGESNYLAWDLVQLFCILFTVYLIYKITWELFESRSACAITALISLGALFFYNYVTFIYGDILSMAPQTLALYMMILYVKRENGIYAIVSAVSIAAAIVLKTNCEITLIALLMILIGSGIRQRRPIFKRLMLALIFLIMTFGVKKGVDDYYCRLTGLEKIPGGSPAWSHIAMGLQESELEDGWYNGYNYQIFAENGYDTEKTGEAAKAEIKAILSDFKNRPLQAAKFFARKFTTQWADSVCISTHNLDLVSRHVENQPKLCDFLVFGKGSQVLIWVMNVFMSVCYIGAAVYLLHILIKRNASSQEMLLLILIFGGMVFHEFWEGSSRYAMRYYIYWLPYAGYGIKVLFDKILREKRD